MIAFVDTEIELSFQDKTGIPDKHFGLEYSLKNKPLDFNYLSDEDVSSFLAIKVDSQGNATESINLSTSLITWDGTYHNCDGLTDYSSDLDEGLYYFLVNSRFKSEYYYVIPGLIESSGSYPTISLSGLGFTDNTIELSWNEKEGSPDVLFGLEYAENSTPLQFEYLSSEAISSFKAVNYYTGEETTLTTSLVIGNGTIHSCSGETNYSSDLGEGVYYFVVNDRYESELFQTFEVDNVQQGIGHDIIGSTLIVY